jgi:protoporphyrin/coproporphyrin ferrochelatase
VPNHGDYFEAHMTFYRAKLASLTKEAFSQPLKANFITPRKIGILLSNLGTPDATDYWSMRRYLSEFLSDRRVIEAPRLIWFFILNGLILTSRPATKGKDYKTIWNRELNESPLKTITRAQAEKLQAAIDAGLLGRGILRIERQEQEPVASLICQSVDSR